MKRIIILITFLISTFQLYAQEQRIIGGQEIDISEAPYIVSIENRNSRENHRAGGVIIGCEWILTTASAISDYSLGLMVHAGSTDQTDNTVGQRIKVDQIILHDNYGVSNGVPISDMALLHLETPLVFNDNVKPIKYATLKNTTPNVIAKGETVSVSGWGTTTTGYPLPTNISDVLRSANMTLISNQDAYDLLFSSATFCPEYALAIDNTMFFGLHSTVDVSQGDFGGPVVIGSGDDATLVGLMSWRSCSKDTFFPNAFTNVRNLASWIDRTIDSGFCFCDHLVDFHFEDENKSDQTEFCVGEDVWIDGSETSNNANHYYMDLWTVDSNGNRTWISDTGWIAGSPDSVNITELFENDPEHPVDFELGVTYALKLAIIERGSPCEWVELYKTFKIVGCCESISKPTNLRRTGSTIYWDPVKGATHYIVQSVPSSWPSNCDCDRLIPLGKTIKTTGTYLTIPSILVDSCMEFHVKAVCRGGISAPSDSICVYGQEGQGFTNIINEAFVAPNPSKGNITFNVLTSDTSEVSIAVHDIYGKLVKFLVVNASPEKMSSVSWDESNLKKGIYFVTFTSKNEKRYSKVIVE